MRSPPPDRAGYAAHELEAGDPGLLTGEGDIEVERAGPCTNLAPFGRDLDEASAQAHHDARDAAVAHQQVGGDADHGDRNIGWLAAEKFREIIDVGGAEHDLGRAADAEPSNGRERRLLR